MTTVGDISVQINITLNRGTDFEYQVNWCEEDGVTPIAVTDADGAIMQNFGGHVNLELGEYVSTSDNVIMVVIPADVTATLPPGAYVWQLQATATTTGKTKVLVRGAVLVQAGIS
jgi:hypothetical protein